MEIPLSDSDVAPYVKHVLVYSQLKDITARQLLKNLPIMILYQIAPNWGHWCLLLKTPEGVEFFDPYSMVPDEEFKEIKWKQPHYLAQRLYEIQRIIPINYNQYQFQSKKEGVNTCGYHCCLRSLCDAWGIDKYAREVVKICKKLGITPDELVTRIITPETLR